MKDIQRANGDIENYDYSPKQIEVMSKLFPQCAGKVTAVQWKYFAYVCHNSKLDPFLKQIYPVPFKNSKTGTYDLVPVTGIDGFRSIAHSTGKLGGISDYLYNGDKTLDDMRKMENVKIPRTATVTVHKVVDGVRVETTASADWISYYPAGKESAKFWDRMPFLKLGYCAEKLALRKAFSEMSGIYLEEEMDNTEIVPNIIHDEEDLETINNIYKEYDRLNYNEAQRMAKNNELGGNPNIMLIGKEKLEYLLTTVTEMEE